jgi:hypothetical protein
MPCEGVLATLANLPLALLLIAQRRVGDAEYQMQGAP